MSSFFADYSPTIRCLDERCNHSPTGWCLRRQNTLPKQASVWPNRNLTHDYEPVSVRCALKKIRTCFVPARRPVLPTLPKRLLHHLRQIWNHPFLQLLRHRGTLTKPQSGLHREIAGRRRPPQYPVSVRGLQTQNCALWCGKIRGDRRLLLKLGNRLLSLSASSSLTVGEGRRYSDADQKPRKTMTGFMG